jgi:hypothetical protein
MANFPIIESFVEVKVLTLSARLAPWHAFFYIATVNLGI